MSETPPSMPNAMTEAFKKARETSEAESPVTSLAIEPPLEAARIREREEDKVVDAGIERSRAAEKYADKITEVYGEKAPPKAVFEMLGKLKGEEKIEGYFAKLRDEEKEKAERAERSKAVREAKAIKRTEEREQMKVARETKAVEKAKKAEEVAAAEKAEGAKSIEERKVLREELYDMYSGKVVPQEVQDKFLLLEEQQLHSLSGSVERQQNALRKMREFIVKQHKIIEANKKPEVVAPEVAGSTAEAVSVPAIGTETANAEASPNTVAAGLEIPTLTEVLPQGETSSPESLKEFESEQKKEVVKTDIPLFAYSEEAPDYIKRALDNEGTPKEWKDKLRDTVGKFFEHTKEKLGIKTERGEHLEGYLASRSVELDAEAAKLGTVEKSFRLLGEKYNKLGWKSKLALGLSLGIGAGALSSVSFVGAAACMSGIAVQRISGMSSAFLKYEKRSLNEKWGKEKAMGKAIAQTVIMTGVMLLLSEGVKEGVAYAIDHQWDDTVREWLGNVLGHNAPAAEAVAGASQPATDITAEVAAIKIPASSHGYEGMMKQLWSQLHEKHIELPANIDHDSDLYRLVHADEKNLDAIVHKIASENEFFHDGTSVRIDTDAQMTIGANGELHLATGGHDYISAPHGMPVAHHAPEVPDTPITMTVTPVEPLNPDAGAALGSDLYLGITPTDATPPVPAVHEALPVPSGSTEGYLVSGDGHPVLDSSGSPVHTGSYEGAAPVSPDIVVNQFGLEISKLEPHVYADESKHLFVFGGSLEDQAGTIQKYLSENPESTIFGTDETGTYRIPFHLIEGQVAPGEPVRNTGLLSFLSSTFTQAPDPKEFRNIIK